MSDNLVSTVNVRGVEIQLNVFNRSLDLCSRMNYETENLDFIDALPSDAVMYDLGACEGRFTIYAALKGIKVCAFEPDRNNFDVLAKNIELNNLSEKITLFNAGVGEKTDKAILQIGQPWPGGHQKVVKHANVREDLNFNFVEENVIDVVSLDEIIISKNLPAPTALKIDIDGSEVPFMKGSVNTLVNANLKTIIFELDKGDKNYNNIIMKLNDAGFSIVTEYTVPNEPTLFNIIFSKKKG